MVKVLLCILLMLFTLETDYADKYDDLVYGSINYQYKSDNNIVDIINNKQYKSADNKKITIMFSNGFISGSSGINRYIGSYSIKNNKIVITVFGSTMMAGSEKDMQLEQEYLKFLKGSHNIKISNDKLFIGKQEFYLIKLEK